MTDLRKAAEQALEALAWGEIEDAKEHLRQALAQPVDAVNMSQERVDETAKRKREWVGLTDDEMQEAGRYSYCRGGTSEKLYHIMWNSQPSASVGWCRAELIAFAQTIEAKLKEKNT